MVPHSGAKQLPDFMIVGTPRSGTTLVQRLATELAGVHVPPETHFFRRLAEPLLLRHVLPLGGPALRQEIETYVESPLVRDLALDPGRLWERVGGSWERVNDLFSAVLEQLADDAAIIGEKTPGHLLWWRPLTEARRDLRLIAVVRDPRAVVSSLLKLGWVRSSVVAGSQRWVCDQRLLRAARSSLGPHRCLVLRYESVVAHPEEARQALGRFLGAAVGVGATDLEARRLFGASEPWKLGVLEPTTTTRIDAWKEELTKRQVEEIEAICAPEMRRYGYFVSNPRPMEGSLSLGRAGARWRFRCERAVRELRIETSLARRGGMPSSSWPTALNRRRRERR